MRNGVVQISRESGAPLPSMTLHTTGYFLRTTRCTPNCFGSINRFILYKVVTMGKKVEWASVCVYVCVCVCVCVCMCMCAHVTIHTHCSHCSH